MTYDRADQGPVRRDARPLATPYTPMRGYDAGAARLAACLPLLGTALIVVSAVLLRA